MNFGLLSFFLFFVVGLSVSDISNTFGQLWSWLDSIIEPLANDLKNNLLKPFWDWLQSWAGWIERFVNWGQGLLNNLNWYMGQFLDLVTSWFNQIHDLAVNLYSGIRNVAYVWINNIWQLCVYYWNNAIHLIVQIFANVVNVAETWFHNIWLVVQYYFNNVIHLAVDLFANIINVASTWLHNIWLVAQYYFNNLVTLVTSWWNGLGWIFNTAWNGLLWWINTGWHWLLNFIQNPISFFESFLIKALEALWMDFAKFIGWLVTRLMSIDVRGIMEV